LGIKMYDLPGRVNARVGSSSTLNHNRLVGYVGKCFFKFSLDGMSALLSLKATVSRAVILNT
jgi:hypothetical protein